MRCILLLWIQNLISGNAPRWPWCLSDRSGLALGAPHSRNRTRVGAGTRPESSRLTTALPRYISGTHELPWNEVERVLKTLQRVQRAKRWQRLPWLTFRESSFGKKNVRTFWETPDLAMVFPVIYYCPITKERRWNAKLAVQNNSILHWPHRLP